MYFCIIHCTFTVGVITPFEMLMSMSHCLDQDSIIPDMCSCLQVFPSVECMERKPELEMQCMPNGAQSMGLLYAMRLGTVYTITVTVINK